MTKITLGIMVRDEEKNIIKTLNSCIPYIDKLIMYDTGSIDKTIELTKNFCNNNNINLYLMQGSFESYSISRNKLLDYIESITPINSFYMIMDANDELKVSYDFVENLQKNVPLNTCVVMVNSRWKVQSTITSHVKVLFIRSGKLVRYDGNIHEYLKINDKPITEKLFIEGIELFQDRKDDEIRTLQRASYDIKKLKDDIKNNKYVGRNTFLVGRTYFNIKEYTKGLKYLTKTLLYYSNGGQVQREDVYMSHYYSAIIKHSFNENWIQHIFDAYNLIPTKIECILFLCLQLSLKSNWRTLYLFAKETINIAKNKHEYADIACSETDYKIYCWYYHILACLHLGKIKEGLKSIKIIDKNIDYYKNMFDINIDEDFDDVIKKYNYLRNIYLPLETLNNNVLENNIVLFGGMSYYKWNGDSINGEIGLGGAETVVTNLAKQMFIRLGKVYNIVVFCDTETNIYSNGVYYLRLDYYDVFVSWRSIKTLFVFRYIDALRYNDNIENVVLVLEDICPIGSNNNPFRYNNKLTKIVCKTDWHKSELISIIPQINNLNNICIIGNGIDIYRFKDIDDYVKVKEDYRFIYTSCMTRGLVNLLNMWPKIKGIIPSATLHLFVTYKCPFYQEHHKIDEMIKMIEDMKDLDIIKHPRISQELLAKEIMVSDIWLYPTEFKETFCISALEMQLGKVLCICSDLAGLKETVGNNRGILVDYSKKDDNAFLNVIRDLRDGVINKDKLVGQGYDWATHQRWDIIVKQFINIL